jgi:predicted N-acetyltransferase YhbS
VAALLPHHGRRPRLARPRRRGRRPGPRVEYDHILAVFDDDQTVGTAGAFSLELTLPGLATVPAAGLSFVAVLPTHRRRGILGALMQPHFNDAETRDEPVSLRYASEASIHGRFGYGTASHDVEYELASRRAAFHAPGQDSGRVRPVKATRRCGCHPRCTTGAGAASPATSPGSPGCGS